MRWISPYYEDGTWLRGNFHTHTTVSDGGHSLEDTADHYFRFGHHRSYHFREKGDVPAHRRHRSG